MYPCRSWIALGLVAALAAGSLVQAAVIYKWTDADGVIHFSDQPVPGAEKFATSGSGKIGFNSPSAASAAQAAAGGKPPGAATSGAHIAITSPGNEETITGNQPVAVHLSLSPELKSSESVVWTLNGSALSEPADATQFSLTDLDRGTYSLSASVSDQATGQTRSPDSVTFYVVRSSLLQPGHKAAGK